MFLITIHNKHYSVNTIYLAENESLGHVSIGYVIYRACGFDH